MNTRLKYDIGFWAGIVLCAMWGNLIVPHLLRDKYVQAVFITGIVVWFISLAFALEEGAYNE